MYQLLVSHFIVAKLDRPELYLRNTLKGFELVLQVNGDTIAVDDRTCWSATHAIKLAIQNGGGQNVTLGTARPDVPLRFAQDGKSRHISHEFVLPLQPAQIHAIEDIRDGGDLALQLTFVGEGGYEAATGSTFPMNDIHHFAVPRSVWIERLRQAKALDVMLLEVPMPFLEDNAKAGPVAKHMLGAQRMFAEGHYDKSVLDCRKALEALGRMEGRLKNWAPVALDGLNSVGRSKMTKEQRELAAQASLHHYANSSAHDGEFDRNDAKLALMLCAAYLTKAFAL